MVDLVTVTKSASQEICWQKLGKAVNLLEDLVSVIKSVQSGNTAGRNWGKGKYTGIFSDCHKSASQDFYSRNGGRGKSAGSISAVT